MGDILEPLDAIHASGVDLAYVKTGGHWDGGGLLVESGLLLMGTRWEKKTEIP
jgi:hypothetical protein